MLNRLLAVTGTLGSAMGSAIGMSDEHRQFYADGYRCQSCKARLMNVLGSLTVQFYAGDGRKMAQWAGGALRARIAECPKCGHRWDMYGAVPVAHSDTMEIVETDRSEESFGEDRRVIDNSKSSSTPTRTFSFSKEWSKTFTVEMEHATSGGADLTLGAKDVAALRVSSEEKLRQTYSVSESVREISTEEVSCQAPAFRKLVVIVQWKRMWQHGFVVLTRDGVAVRIPFRAAVGVTFDQQQIDDEAVGGGATGSAPARDVRSSPGDG